MDLARDSVDAEAVDPVRRHLELQHRLGEWQRLRQRRARREAVVEHEDPVGVFADLQLGRRRGSSRRRRRPRSFALRSFSPPGILAPGRATGDGLPGGRRSAHRRRSSAPPSPMSTVQTLSRSASGWGSAASTLPTTKPSGEGGPTVVDPLDLGPGHRQPLGQLLRRDPGVAVFAQPRVRDPHRNCSSIRTSLSKKRRRSGTPWRSIAIRSTPMPKAKPWTRSGS